VKCFAGCSFESILHNSRIVDMYLLALAREYHLVLPSKRNREKKGKSEGATVLQPSKKGVYYWVVVFDLKSLYPNCFLSLNLGADTIVLNPPATEVKKLIKSPLKDVYFRKDFKSFIAKMIEDLLNYRDELREILENYKTAKDTENEELYNRIQTVVKFITNSIFGVMGLPVFRLFDKNIFDNVLTTTRMVIHFSMQIVKKHGYNLLYGDTDSIFVLMHSTNLNDLKQESNVLCDVLNQSYKLLNKVFNTNSNTFKMKVDKKFKSILMVNIKGSDKVGKKHYAGIKDNDELEVVGFDRTDMSICGNTIMKKVLEYAARGQKDAIVEYLTQEIAKIKTMQYSLGEIAFAKGIKQRFSEYKTKGDWVRAAEWTNKHSYLWGVQTNYGIGSKPKFIYVKSIELPKAYDRTTLIALDEYENLPESLVACIDFEKVINNTVKEKIVQILDAIGLDWDTLFNTAHIQKLTQY
jgi:DNA polymerase elongation subunit (family B)